MMGLLKYVDRHDFATAARYLQPPPGQDKLLAKRAEELLAVQPKFKGSLALLSDEPNGTVEQGLPPGEVRAGVVTEGDTNVDVILVRVDDPKWGKIWLVSQGTVAHIPEIYAQMQSEAPTLADRITRATHTGPKLLGLSVRQLLGWLISIPLAWPLAWLLEFLLSAPRRIWGKIRKLPLKTILDTPPGLPLRCIVAIGIHGLFVYLLELPVLYRFYYARFLQRSW
jgi:MscS family membrane protein